MSSAFLHLLVNKPEKNKNMEDPYFLDHVNVTSSEPWSSLVGSFLQTEMFTDCRINCQDGHVSAHRIILASWSQFIKRIFTEQTDNDDCVILLPDFPSKTVKALCEYIYGLSDDKIVEMSPDIMQCLQMQNAISESRMDNQWNQSFERKLLKKNNELYDNDKEDTNFVKKKKIKGTRKAIRLGNTSQDQTCFQDGEMRYSLVCQECENRFRNLNRLCKHFQSHVDPKFRVSVQKNEAQCFHCNMAMTKTELPGHMQSFHASSIMFHCDACQKVFPNFEDLCRHQGNNHVKSDTTCIKLETDAEQKSEQELISRHCTTCQLSFDNDQSFQQHFEFNMCQLTQNGRSLKRKVNTEEDELEQYRIKRDKHKYPANYICQHCALNFSSAKKYYCHLLDHIPPDLKVDMQPGVDYAWCPDCAKPVLAKSITYHRARTHEYEANKFCDYRCDFCNKNFRTRADLKLHLQFPPHVTPGNEPKEKGAFMCDECGQTFFRKAHLNIHFASKHKKWRCDECDIDFKHHSQLTRHRITKHNLKQRDIICDECGELFYFQFNLNAHYYKKHSNELRYPCDLCGERFKYTQYRKKHQESCTGKLTASRDKVCRICNEGFYFERDLEEHVRKLHSEENRYPCKFCGEKFKFIQQRKTHEDVCPKGSAYGS